MTEPPVKLDYHKPVPANRTLAWALVPFYVVVALAVLYFVGMMIINLFGPMQS